MHSSLYLQPNHRCKPARIWKYRKKLRPIWLRKHIKKKKIEGRPYGVGSLENHLLCLLMYYRTYTTQLFIGFYFGVDDATVCRTIKRLEPLLWQIIKIKREPKISQKKLKTLLLDATEQEVTGSSREYYSGKKKRQTIKTEIIVERQSGLSRYRILSLEECTISRCGGKVILSLLRDQFMEMEAIRECKKNTLTSSFRKGNHGESLRQKRASSIINRIWQFAIL